MNSDKDIKSQSDQALDYFNAGDYRRARKLAAGVLHRYGDSSLAAQSQFLQTRLRIDWLEIVCAGVGIGALLAVYL